MTQDSTPSLALRRIGPGASLGDGERALAPDGHLAAALLTLWQQVAAGGGDPVFGPEAQRPEIAPEVAELIQAIRSGSAIGVAATVGTDLVGAAVMTRRGTGPLARTGEIRALLADTADRGSAGGAGIGDQLLDELLEQANERDLRDVMVTVADRSGAAEFYRRRDFAEVGRWLSPDAWDEVLLRRPLGDQRARRPRKTVAVELSHVIHDGLLTYPGIPAPRIGSHLSFDESAEHYAPGTEFSIATIALAANTGTYLDTPAHRYRGMADLAELDLSQLVDLPGVVIDLRSVVATNGRRIDRLPLPDVDIDGHAVLVLTGHSARWGTDGYFADHPHLAAGAVEQLLDRGPALVGIDSLNIDGTSTGERPAHSLLLGRGIPIVEHLAHLDGLPEQGFRFFAAPPRISGMATFPVRAFALLDEG